MAEVFRATGEGPEVFERTFVVKRILPGLSDAPEFVRMFVDEAKISARLLHPNIVQVFEFAYQDGGYYIVMEPVDGVDMGLLLRKLERRGRWRWPRSRRRWDGKPASRSRLRRMASPALTENRTGSSTAT